MKLFGNENKIDPWYNRILPYMILVDIVLITISLILDISDEILYYIEIFDLAVCIILLCEYFYGLVKAPSEEVHI